MIILLWVASCLIILLWIYIGCLLECLCFVFVFGFEVVLVWNGFGLDVCGIVVFVILFRLLATGCVVWGMLQLIGRFRVVVIRCDCGVWVLVVNAVDDDFGAG